MPRHPNTLVPIWSQFGPQVSGAAKAAAIRAALGLENSPDTLLDALAAQNKVLACAETDTQWELVIGHDLISPTLFFTDERIHMQLKPDALGCTAWSRRMSSSSSSMSGADGDADGDGGGDWGSYDDSWAFREVAAPRWIVGAAVVPNGGGGSLDNKNNKNDRLVDSHAPGAKGTRVDDRRVGQSSSR
jgi:hypothetical protein